MRIEVTGKNFELTPSTTQYVENKCAKLTKYFNGVMEIEAVLEEVNHTGNEFAVEIRADAVKHKDFVAKQEGTDVFECIDKAVDKMTRQLTDYKEKLKDKR